MKTFLAIFLVIMTISCAGKQDERSLSEQLKNVEYSEELATLAGADEYGMQKYVIAFLKRGPNRPTDKKVSSELQRAHMENIGKLAEAGKLVLAGPFLDNGDLRGIYIFNVETIEEAKALTHSDPAIKYGSLVMELHPWYGSASLFFVNELHKGVSKIEI